jgi:glucose-6-phosphate 1-dehydrogenase
MTTPENNESVVGPCVVVIFGASGDLAQHKLIPSLANLAEEGLLSEEFAVIGVATRPWTDEDFRALILDDEACKAPVSEQTRRWLAERMTYMSGDVTKPETYERLHERLLETDKTRGTGGNYLFYLSTAPRFFAEIPKQLREQNLIKDTMDMWRRVIIEKPFGTNLETARELNVALREVLKERQIYRIDHYLGKETVQNIVAFRFANGIFEPLWNRRYIDHVQITAAEESGIYDRGRYYEESGVLRDMVPNHLFQLVTMTAMEPSISFAANEVRDEQVKVLKAIRPLEYDVVRGQYGPAADGSAVGYRSEQYVEPESNTPTFVAAKLLIENWRWSGVPFYLRTGKRLPERTTEIAICFKQEPFALFGKVGISQCKPNWLVLRVQPNEGISLSFGAKRPGTVMKLGTVKMDFSYQDYFGDAPQAGYERLLYDCMLGDATLFQRADMVEEAWSVVNPVLKFWESVTPEEFPNYVSGTWGPEAAFDLLRRDGREWRK